MPGTRTIMIAGLLLILAAGRALPQQPINIRELIAENERLIDELREARAAIDRLEGEVAGLRNDRRGLESRVRDAEQVLTSLRRELAGDRQTNELAEDRAPTPADPLASPASLLRELRATYFEAMRDVPDATPAERDSYRQQAALWCRLTQRELRGKRTWLVEFDDLVPLRDNRAVARMTVVDEQSGLPIGDPVDVAVPARFAERIGGDPRYDRWLLTAIVIARPQFNESRKTRGVFEYPPFVGPNVDFDFELDWVSVRGWRPGQTEPADDGGAPDQPAESPESPAGIRD